MTEAYRMKTMVVFQDIEVTAGKDRLWQVDARSAAASIATSTAGRSASATFLDQAINFVLPRLASKNKTG
jgi:hypothetical protein